MCAWNRACYTYRCTTFFLFFAHGSHTPLCVPLPVFLPTPPFLSGPCCILFIAAALDAYVACPSHTRFKLLFNISNTRPRDQGSMETFFLRGDAVHANLGLLSLTPCAEAAAVGGSGRGPGLPNGGPAAAEAEAAAAARAAAVERRHSTQSQLADLMADAVPRGEARSNGSHAQAASLPAPVVPSTPSPAGVATAGSLIDVTGPGPPPLPPPPPPSPLLARRAVSDPVTLVLGPAPPALDPEAVTLAPPSSGSKVPDDPGRTPGNSDGLRRCADASFILKWARGHGTCRCRVPLTGKIHTTLKPGGSTIKAVGS